MSDRQEIETLRERTDSLIEATHVGAPWQVSSAQKAWDEALDALADRLAESEARERTLRQAAERVMVEAHFTDAIVARGAYGVLQAALAAVPSPAADGEGAEA